MIGVAGRGIAALTCLQLLKDRGCEVVLCGPSRTNSPTALLSQDTLQLIADIFSQPSVLTLGHPIQGRLISWGNNEKSQIQDPGRSVSLNRIAATLDETCAGKSLLDRRSMEEMDADVDVWIDATGRSASVAGQLANVSSIPFGQRQIIAADAPLQSNAHTMCVVEQCEQGWLFLLPTGKRQAVVQLMLPRIETDPQTEILAAVGRSSEIASRLSSMDNLPLKGVFPAAPRILSATSGDGWIAAGESAFSMDPISGDGIGSAVRSSILACAVLAKMKTDADRRALEYLHRRQLRAFTLHLKFVYEHYDALRNSSANWRRELETTARYLASRGATTVLENTDLGCELAGLSLQISKPNSTVGS